VREPVSAEQLARFLDYKTFDVEEDLERVAAFFPKRGGHYHVYHKSIIDWLTGQAGQSRQYRVDIAGGHRQIATRLLNDYRAGNRDRFTLAHLPSHLREAGNRDQLDQLLGSASFVRAKCLAGMMQKLIDDYDLTESPELHVIQEALRLSAHVLGNDVGQLAGQILGRLGVGNSPLVRNFTEDLRRETTGLWLRPTTPSLIQVGGPLLRTLVGHEEWVYDVVFGKLTDGTPVVVSAGPDGLRAWDPEFGNQLWALPIEKARHPIAIGALADGKPCLIAIQEGNICFLDLATGRQLSCPISPVSGGVRAIASGFMAGKPVVVISSGTRSGPSNTGGLWSDNWEESKIARFAYFDMLTGAQIGEPLVGHSEPITELALGEISGRMTIASVCDFSKRDEPRLRLWDAKSGQERQNPFDSVWRQYAVAFGKLANGATVVAVGCDFGRIMLWNSNERRPDDYKIHEDDVQAIAFAELNGKPVFISGSGNTGSRPVDCTVRILDPASGEQIGQAFTGHSDAVASVAFGHNRDQAPVIVSGSNDGTLRVWDATADSQLCEPSKGHTFTVKSLAFGELDGKPIVISGGWDSTVRIWDPATGSQCGEPLLRQSLWIGAVTFGRLVNGRGVFVTADGGKDGTMRLWDASSREQFGKSLVGHTDWIESLRFGYLDETAVIVSASHDGTIRTWNLETQEQYGEAIFHDSSQKGLYDWVFDVAFGELDGRQVIISGAQNGEARIWDPATGEQVQEPLRGTHQSNEGDSVRECDVGRIRLHKPGA
jgi:WD40 repeat protein